MSLLMNIPSELITRISRLVECGVGTKIIDCVEPCYAGGNNRTFRVQTPLGIFAAKQYFRSEQDTRDRLNAEYDFLVFAHQVAKGLVPQPYARDAEYGLALYEFIVGNPLKVGEIGLEEISAATDFFKSLNSVKSREDSPELPVASEACFSIEAHLELVGSRLNSLLEITPYTDEDACALNLITSIQDYWALLLADIKADAAAIGLKYNKPLASDQRCISPSDFGFHNALRQADGTIRFLDFEYAGWDDPAKTTGDFFAQLAIPVPHEYFAEFVAEIMCSFSDIDSLVARAHLLRPVYQVKWCCIALNIFLPINLARRTFANPGLDVGMLKRNQLAKAEILFKSLRTMKHGLH